MPIVGVESTSAGSANIPPNKSINGVSRVTIEDVSLPEFSKDAILQMPELNLSDKEKESKIREWMKSIFLTDEDVELIRKAFLEEIERGLEKTPEQKSSLQMENTFLPELPDGTDEFGNAVTEKDGVYLALDLGGTNFRVILLRMRKGEIIAQKVDYFHVPEAVRLGSGEQLFDFLAACIEEFVVAEKVSQEILPLGFCFSFPMHHAGLNIGILASWTKSFNCSGVIGKDVVKMLNTALHKKNIHVDVIAVLNDTTGTLVAGAQKDHDCAIGLIMGTGCNACYLEKVSRIGKWEGPHYDENEVVVDIEWGAFGDNGCIEFLKTKFDKEVDKQSLLAGTFTFEKYISGKYIGEIVRHVMIDLAEEGPFFGNHASERLLQFGSFTAKHVSTIEGETLSGGTDKIREVMSEMDLIYDKDDLRALQYICAVVSLRAAQLVAICVGYLLTRMNKPTATIAVDGSLYKNHPRLKGLMDHYTAVYAPGCKFQYMLALDGSGKGAGMVAAIAKRLTEKRTKSESDPN